jgi:cob(I)alamin adenosyltransferase
MKYLNRLSDLAFVSARWLAKDLAIPEVLWKQS